jgi:hypothetical protein
LSYRQEAKQRKVSDLVQLERGDVEQLDPLPFAPPFALVQSPSPDSSDHRPIGEDEKQEKGSRERAAAFQGSEPCGTDETSGRSRVDEDGMDKVVEGEEVGSTGGVL